jgi:hypothetical protein
MSTAFNRIARALGLVLAGLAIFILVTGEASMPVKVAFALTGVLSLACHVASFLTRPTVDEPQS